MELYGYVTGGVDMSDSNVLAAQVYLNAMFGGHPSWVSLDEDGITGIATMQGIVRAFQINNNVGGVTGSIGPLTIAKFKSLPTISKMNPSDPSSINVCLIQCALFCKGYAAGGITGIYYNAGEAAVKSYQSDAGLVDTGIINWKVWLGLLSLNWFKLTATGVPYIRAIQQNLNSDHSDVIGVIACDGEISRYTVLSLIGALQHEENVTTDLIVDLNTVNFGVATTNNFPSSLKKNQNGSSYIGYNKLAQYGLYFNGYDPGNFDGIFDATMEEKVSEFQTFYGLNNIGLVTDGEVNVSTMKSLLTSKGDTGRTSKACDCATVLTQTQAGNLVSAGYTHVGRYLTGYVGVGVRKYMTFEEISNINNAGLRVFPIYQDGGYSLEYFLDKNQGVKDAYLALNAADRIGVPDYSTIYFAVDFDCYKYQVDDYIIPYFEDINSIFDSEFNTNNYKVGVYGPRYVCQRLYELEYAEYSFVADMSSGFSCNLGYKLPSNWAFDQFYEYQFISSPSFDLDKDAYSGRDIGINSFEQRPYMTPQQMENDNFSVIVDNEVRDYVLKSANAFGVRDKFVAGELRTGVDIPLGSFNFGGISITFKARLEDQLSDHTDLCDGLTISLDNDGNLSTACNSRISEIESNIDISGLDSSKIGNLLRSISLSLKQGEIMLRYTPLSTQSWKIDFVIESGDLFPDNVSVDREIVIEYSLIFEISNLSNYNLNINYELVDDEHVKSIMAVFLVAIIVLWLLYQLAFGVFLLLLTDIDLLFEEED